MATTEQFSLRWNNFHSNITTGFHELLENADLVDVTLAVEGQYLQAHKLVLSICSPYFKQMFKLNPCKHPIVILKDVAHDNLKDILDFMYMGEVNILREKLPSFLRTAELLQVKGLTSDDSQSDTSSKPDDREFFDDEEPGFLQEERTATSLLTPQKHKRSQASKNVGGKKPKVDNIKQVKLPKETPDFPLNNIKVENKSSLNDDGFLQSGFDPGAFNSLPADLGPQEQEVIMFSVDEKGHVGCPYCYKTFVNRYNLKVHIRDKHDTSSSNLDCYICKKTMRNRSCLRVHMYHHRKQEQANNEAKNANNNDENATTNNNNNNNNNN